MKIKTVYKVQMHSVFVVVQMLNKENSVKACCKDSENKSKNWCTCAWAKKKQNYNETMEVNYAK